LANVRKGKLGEIVALTVADGVSVETVPTC
jgi:hypothetical protein